MRRSAHLPLKGIAIVCAASFAAAALAKEGETRDCKTFVGGQVVCGDLVIGITLEQYEDGLQKRAEEIRAEEAKKRDELQGLMNKQLELTERATAAEKESLRSQIDVVEAQRLALEAESKGIADRLKNLQANYDQLVQKLAEANAALTDFAPLISTDAFEQARAMLSRGDVLGAEGKFIEIANTVAKLREKADVVEARALFQAGALAEQRIDWRAASAHYHRAAALQPSNRSYAESAGKLAVMLGDYPTAASFNEAALRLAASEFGPDAPQTAAALNNLALTYKKLARYAETEPLYREAIAVDEKVLGKEHPDLATGYNNLASVLTEQARFAEAEPLIREAIAIDEKALGKEHPNVATFYNNLASVLKEQGKFAEAEPLIREAIAIDEKALGKEHPNVATFYNNLASVLKEQGKYTEAESLYRQAIAVDEKALGRDNPDVAICYNNLAELLRVQRKYAEAEPLYREAIAVDEKVLGKEHPNVARDYNNFALLLQAQRKYAEAEPLYREAIAVDEKALGKEHPTTVKLQKNYDGLRRLMDKNSAAPGR